jgi:hypothetical protein
MNHVERQNQGGHVKLYGVLMDSGDRPVRHIAAMSKDEAVRDAAEYGRVRGAVMCYQHDASDALLIARRALAEACAESTKGRR